MKIVHLIGSSSYDGSCIMAFYIASGLNSYTHKIFNQSIGSAQNELIEKGMNLLFPLNTNKFVRIIRMIFLVVKFNKTNTNYLLHYHSGSIVLCKILTLLSRNKVIFTVHCWNLHCKAYHGISDFRRKIYDSIFKKSQITTVSNSTYRYLRKMFSGYSIILIKNALPNEKHPIKNYYSLSFGYLGQISEPKGSSELIEFINSLNTNDNKIVVMGETKDNYSHINFNKCLHKVTRLPQQFDKSTFFDSISFLLFPSKLESFGLVILDAVIFNCPVICYNTESNRELLTSDYPLFVDDFSKNTIIPVAQRFAQDELFQKRVLGCLESIKNKHDFKLMIKSYKEIYDAN